MDKSKELIAIPYKVYKKRQESLFPFYHACTQRSDKLKYNSKESCLLLSLTFIGLKTSLFLPNSVLFKIHTNPLTQGSPEHSWLPLEISKAAF